MSERLLIREARRRERIFKNLDRYLKKLKKEMKKLDENSRLFLFGSVLRSEHVLMSDIDVLILTDLKPKEVIAKLRKTGFDEPFEFHVVDKKGYEVYRYFVHDLRELNG